MVGRGGHRSGFVTGAVPWVTQGGNVSVSLSFLVEAMEETGNVKSSPCLQWEAN